MQRRDILRRAGAATAVGLLAGCLGRNGGSPGGSGDTTDETTTTTTTTTATTKTGTTETSTDGTPTVEKRSLKIIDAGCGQPKNEASVEFEDSKKRMIVTGTIAGSDSCAQPTLKIGKTDPKKDAFDVIIGTKKKDGSVGCSECITEIEYRATITFADALPKSVKVTHESLGNSKVVTGADRDSTTASAGK